ncbi:MAG: LysE family translocator [Exilibacterium sp.]
MIDLHSYLLFIVASVLLVIVPGPDMIYMLSRSIAQGRRAGLVAALGINLGGYVHLTATVLGLSAILATSSLAFTFIKWTGAAYLIYIGIQAIRSNTGPFISRVPGITQCHRSIFWQGFWSDVLNPKVAMFFLAFLPQFVAPANKDPMSTLILLGVTLNVIAISINVLLVIMSTMLTRKLRSSAMISAWLNRAMGALFIALGLRLASEKS